MMFILCIGTINAYHVWVGGTSMCPPDCENRYMDLNESVRPEEIRIGDIIGWQAHADQLAPYMMITQPVDEETLKRNLIMGLPTKQINYDSWVDKSIAHAIIWCNETHFITKGTNPKTNAPYRPDDYNLTWKRNYMGRMEELSGYKPSDKPLCFGNASNATAPPAPSTLPTIPSIPSPTVPTPAAPSVPTPEPNGMILGPGAGGHYEPSPTPTTCRGLQYLFPTIGLVVVIVALSAGAFVLLRPKGRKGL